MIISQQLFGVETMMSLENKDLRAVHNKDDLNYMRIGKSTITTIKQYTSKHFQNVFFFQLMNMIKKKNINNQSESIKVYRVGHRTAMHTYNKQSMIMHWCGH